MSEDSKIKFNILKMEKVTAELSIYYYCYCFYQKHSITWYLKKVRRLGFSPWK